MTCERNYADVKDLYLKCKGDCAPPILATPAVFVPTFIVTFFLGFITAEMIDGD